MSCNDVPEGHCGTRAIIIGHDPGLWAMALLDHKLIVQDVAGSLGTLDNFQIQHNLWVDNPYGPDQLTYWWQPTRYQSLRLYGSDDGTEGKKSPENRFFVSSLPNGTNTGVLRQHALRLNSTVTCENVTRSESPLRAAEFTLWRWP